MKIRNGFVSNSSSSSFLIVGKRVKFEDITPENIESGKVYCEGDDINDGMDVFNVTSEMYEFTINNDKIMQRGIWYIAERTESEEPLLVRKEDVGFEVIIFKRDYESSQNVNDLKARYG